MKCNVPFCPYKNCMGYCMYTDCMYPDLYNQYNIKTFSDSTSDTIYEQSLYINYTTINKENT